MNTPEYRPMANKRAIDRAPNAFVPPRGQQMIIVGSKAGHEKHPAWYYNLKARPDAEVDVRGQRQEVRARVLEGEERSEAWRYVNDHCDGYDRYQSMVARQIPVVVLEPRSP